MEFDYDVVIIGGAFSGAATALMIKRKHPAARVLIIEKNAAFDRKVDESTTEVSSCYMTRILGLANYLGHEQLAKQGLRMWFCNSTEQRFDDCVLSALHRPDRLSQIQDHCARTNSSCPQRGIAGRSHRRCDAELGASVGRSGQLLLATMIRLYPVVLKTARARLSSGSPVANTTARIFRQRTSR